LLITSIVMMLVVAVALSTATYAWFTSNTSVTAKSINITAGTSNSSALGIAWQKSSGTPGTTFNAQYQTYVLSVDAATSQTGGFQPAAPAALTNAEPTFHTAYIDAQGKFQDTPGAATTAVYRFRNYEDSAAATAASANFSDLIHIANLAQSGSVGVTLTAHIDAPLVAIENEAVDTTTYNYYDNTRTLVTPTTETYTGYKQAKSTDNTAVDFVRIAVYEVTVSGEEPSLTYSYACKGVMSSDGDGSTLDTAVGTITAGNTAVDLKTVASTTSISLGSIAAQNDKAYAVYVWLDGIIFDEARGGQSASVSLTFATVS